MSSLASLLLEPVSSAWASLLIRWAIGLSLLPYPIKKIREPQGAEHFPAVFFFSPKAAYRAAMLVELIVSLCLPAGFLVRPVALAGIVNMGVATKVSMQPGFISPALVFLLSLIAIFIIGPGTFSLDALLW